MLILSRVDGPHAANDNGKLRDPAGDIIRQLNLIRRAGSLPPGTLRFVLVRACDQLEGRGFNQQDLEPLRRYAMTLA